MPATCVPWHVPEPEVPLKPREHEWASIGATVWRQCGQPRRERPSAGLLVVGMLIEYEAVSSCCRPMLHVFHTEDLDKGFTLALPRMSPR